MQFQDNKDLAREAENALAAAGFVGSEDIKVKADEGLLTLEGVVDSDAQRQKAVSAVRTLPGVKNVKDELRLRGHGDQSMGEYLDDTKITAAIKAKLMGEKGVPSMKVHVETKDGIVILTGETETHEQSLAAERVARSADGVVEVRNNLVVRP